MKPTLWQTKNRGNLSFAVSTNLAEKANPSISTTASNEGAGSGFDYLLLDIERTEKPSATLMKALANQREIVTWSGGRLNRTLLHHAAAHDKLKTVKYLCLQCSANVNAEDQNGDTPLDYALAVNAGGVADYLRLKGARNKKDSLAPTPAPVFANINTNYAEAFVPEALRKSLQLALTECEVNLAVEAAPDSVFTGWDGDASGVAPTFSLLMNAEKSVSATFQLKSFELTLSRAGTGSGTVACTPDGHSHSIGSLINLSATPEPGSVFVGWSGDLTENASTGTLVMDSAKTVVANFSRLSFALDATTSGSGTGTITRSLEAGSYDYGSTVTLTAQADDGSIFNGWSSNAEGLDATCTVRIDSAKRITAEFVKLDIPDLEIHTTFDSAEKPGMKSGDEAFIFYLAIANNGQKQIRIELPLSSYVTRHGEEIEQDAWLTGLINGAQGATLRSGTFRKIGLVFFTSKLRGVTAGDHLHLTVAQTKPARRFNFTLRCTDHQSRAFTLIDVVEETQIQTATEVVATSTDTAAMLQRIEVLESGLREVLRQLKILQTAPHATAGIPASENAPAPMLADVLTWLATQERVSLAVLRSHLFPLDLLPAAVINEVNERALDLTGEPAFEEDDEEETILVAKEILAQVLISREVA